MNWQRFHASVFPELRKKFPGTVTADRTILLPLSGEIVANLTVSTHGTAEHYPGYRLQVIHKNAGKLDEHYFDFDDYFSKKDGGKARHEVITYCCKDGVADWYIARPTPGDVREYEGAVLAYLLSYGAGARRKTG